MKVAVFSTKPYDEAFLTAANQSAGHELSFLEARLLESTAPLAAGADAVCAFVNDVLDAAVLERLGAAGIRLIALRSAGYNNVDLAAAAGRGITVARVPAYSPHAVAEHTIALILALDRNIHRAYNRVREGNFSIDGLLGFDLCGKTVGVVGAGKIGRIVATLLKAFGCEVLVQDPFPSPELAAAGIRQVSSEELIGASDIITLHCPLTPDTYHLIGPEALARVKPGVMLVNTSRGAIVDTLAVIEALKDGRVGALALDVYEEEADLFFEDLSNQIIKDDVLARLLTFPNVLITSHQAFFTREAMQAIAETTIGNITAFQQTGRVLHEVSLELVA